MKRLFAFLFLFTIMFSNSVSAHSGRTDASGGHNCSQKSINKGLCTGYHYHNGGSSAGSSSGGSRPSYNPKVYYDQGYNQGYKDGYAAGYKKAQSLPSTNNSNADYTQGFQVGYNKGYEEGKGKIAKEEAEAKDKTDGHNQGTTDGTKVFNEGGGVSSFTYPAGSSDIYIAAYKPAFQTSWELAKNIKEAYDNGKELGLQQDDITIPAIYATDQLKAEFEKGHTDGVTERDNKEKERYSKDGYSLGYDTQELAVPVDVKKDIYIEAYKEGYNQGLADREKEANAEGYKSAFKFMNYKESEKYKNNDKLLGWYKDGYESNKLAKEIKEKAKSLGKEADKYYIPKKYKVDKEAISLYNKLFEEGQLIKEQNEKKTRNTLLASAAVVVPVAGGGLFFYRRKKKIS